MRWAISSDELEMRIWLFRSGNLPQLRVPLRPEFEVPNHYVWLGKRAAKLAFGDLIFPKNVITWTE